MASSKAQAQKRRRLVNKALSHLQDLPIDMVRDFPFEPMYLVFWGGCPEAVYFLAWRIGLCKGRQDVVILFQYE